jgi:hypothetical protein
MRYVTSFLVCFGLMFLGYTYGTNSTFKSKVDKSVYNTKVFLRDTINKVLK